MNQRIASFLPLMVICFCLTATSTLAQFPTVRLSKDRICGSESVQVKVTLAQPASAYKSVLIGINRELLTIISNPLENRCGSSDYCGALYFDRGEQSKEFTLITKANSSDVYGNISARDGTYTDNTSLTVLTPIASVNSFPYEVASGQNSTGRLVCNCPAGSGGAIVNLRAALSGNASTTLVSLPSSVVVPQGQLSVDFPIRTSAVQADTTVFLIASFREQTLSSSMLLRAACSSPAISSQPSDQTLLSGQSVTLKVEATGSSLQYQWFQNGNAIAGATSNTYSSQPLSSDSSYFVRVKNSCGSVDSRVVTVKILVCNYVLAASPPRFGYDGGAGLLAIQTNAGCPWSAVVDVDWLHLPATSGIGSASLVLSVLRNDTANERTANIRISGRLVTVTQAKQDSSCPVQPLTPITDAEALTFENGQSLNTALLSQRMRTANDCLRSAIEGGGGTYRLNSAYRPSAYQLHLREVWDKWDALRDNTATACRTLRTAVEREVTQHGLANLQTRPAGAGGAHTQGEAIDVSINNIGVPLTTVLDQATRCRLTRPLPVVDPPHFTYRENQLQTAPPVLADLLLESPDSFFQQPQPLIRLLVTQQTRNGQIIYSYRILNNSNTPVSSIRVGYDHYRGQAELIVPPVGWSYQDGLSASSASSPRGWQVRLITEEESEFLNLNWNSQDSASLILFSQILDGFAVALPETDNRYLTGHWTVVLANGAKLTGSLEPEATALVTVSAASYRGNEISNGAIAAAFGDGLSASSQSANTLPLPTSLGGVSLKLKDSLGVERLAQLFFVSSNQTNFLLPPDAARGDATITLTGNGKTFSGSVRVGSSPGVFSANGNGQGVAAAVALRLLANKSQQYEPIAIFDSVQNKFIARPIDLGQESDQMILLLFGTGFNTVSTVSAKIDGIEVPVLYAGPQGNLVGLDQINLHVPRSLIGRGDVGIDLTVDGKPVNTVRVSIK